MTIKPDEIRKLGELENERELEKMVMELEFELDRLLKINAKELAKGHEIVFEKIILEKDLPLREKIIENYKQLGWKIEYKDSSHDDDHIAWYPRFVIKFLK